MILPGRKSAGTLPPGRQLQEYRIQKLLSAGSWSNVYLAHDTRLDRKVALKEYLPTLLAMRAPGGEVVPRLPRFEAAFQRGLQSFLEEARLLAGFDHPGLVKVLRWWAEGGTGYMAMPYCEGITLQQWLTDLGTPPSEAWLRALLAPLLSALGALHAQQCLHRNVSPDNILLLVDRSSDKGYLEQPPRPLLLDFGAARRVIGDATQSLSAQLKTGYSPVEQYEGEGSLRQGPWTDIYALSALLYTAVVGKPPAAAVARVVQDETVPARRAAQGRCSDVFLAAIDAGLGVRPEQRPQSLAAFRTLLDATMAPPLAPHPAVAPTAVMAVPVRPATAAPAWLWLAGGAVLLALGAFGAWLLG
jgi:serine/threonine protein kinase